MKKKQTRKKKLTQTHKTNKKRITKYTNVIKQNKQTKNVQTKKH